jgi:hypothetical protein
VMRLDRVGDRIEVEQLRWPLGRLISRENHARSAIWRPVRRQPIAGGDIWACVHKSVSGCAARYYALR